MDTELSNTKSTLPVIVYLLGGLVIVGIIALLVLVKQLGNGGLRDLIKGLNEIPADHTINNFENHYQLSLLGNSWRDEEIGKHSDGSALAEYTGLNKDAGIIVFLHDDVDNITETTQWRIEQSLADIPDASCFESRSLIPVSLNLLVYVECEGLNKGYSKIDAYQFLQTSQNTFIELYGNLSASKNQYKKQVANFRGTIQSLAPADERIVEANENLAPTDKDAASFDQTQATLEATIDETK